MAALRKLLMYFSALSAVAIFAAWVFLSRKFDILPLGVMTMLAVNAFYLYFSRPTVKTSDIFDHASSKLALASLELKYLSEEAQIREAEAEKLRLEEAKKEQYKLQVAKDILEHLQAKISSRASQKIVLPQIPHRPRIGNEVLAQLAVSQADAKSEESEAVSRPMAIKVSPSLANGAAPAAVSST